MEVARKLTHRELVDQMEEAQDRLDQFRKAMDAQEAFAFELNELEPPDAVVSAWLTITAWLWTAYGAARLELRLLDEGEQAALF